MNRILPLAAAALLAGCTQAQIKQGAADAQVAVAEWAPVAGQLFCALQKAGGGTFIVAVINGAVSSSQPGALPISVIVTGAAKSFVDEACNRAATAVSAVAAIPVSPPISTAGVPLVAIVPPTEGTAP